MCGQSLATSPASWACPFPDSEDHLRIPGPQTVEVVLSSRHLAQYQPVDAQVNHTNPLPFVGQSTCAL
ncbi:uncharacterized protein TRAVEDRAFT_56515 [Trametes versicolor FP-101664 SS1]|uniref:uncharacterized protein n=1 Tax=Trametes versicolor (strain FP-101664) TaxID=717944 RepID=UPI0004622665|nr:uncharacterized protein TRAVEDRAFT_56515 [Trametes versicolor FP-101664 SS1]EIW63597.1 hypothetical protein TRAVEDRAFT_56515 [Trametes versicolor FP-101664 SS1]